MHSRNQSSWTDRQRWWYEEQLPRIEAIAYQEIAKYEQQFGRIGTLYTPIAPIIESLWGLEYKYDDLTHYDVPVGTIGFLDHHQRLIVLDENLEHEGRENFTLAHEGGHWKLHLRHRPAPGQLSLLGKEEGSERYFCRWEGEERWMFREAHHFAACILMPRHKLVPVAKDRLQFVAKGGCALDSGRWRQVLQALAEDFRVSQQAMGLRLQELGLVTARQDGGVELVYQQHGPLFSG